MQRNLEGDVQLAQVDAKLTVCRLTPIQRAILSGLLGGESSRSLAAALHMDTGEYETQRAALMTQLNAGSTAEAVRIALLAGMDEPRRRTSPD
jgi:FixJ family two-component response regulator